MKIKSLLVVAVLATAILCFGGAVNAQTDNSALIAQLQAQIAQLTAQLQQLIAQQGGGQTWCHTFNNYLVASSTDANTGGDVSQLQTALTKQGLDVSGDSQGTFGDNTASAVVQFQGKNGIRQTGTVGPITRTKLNSLYGCGTKPLPTNCTSGQTLGCNVGGGAGLMTCYNGQWSSCVVSSPTPTNGSVSITSPTTNNVSWQRGTLQTIAWTSTSPSVDITLSSTSNVFNGSSSLLLIGGQTGSTWSWSAGNWKDGVTSIAPDGNYTMWVCPTGTETGPLCGSFNLNIYTPAGQPSLTVTSPNGGEQLVQGQTYNITWTSQNIPSTGNIYIALVNDTLGRQYGLTTTIGNSGSYSWTVPTTNINYDSILGNQFKIQVQYSPSTTVYSAKSSNYFSIVTPASLKQLTITSPNGGEQWQVGTTQNITWTSSGFSSGATVAIGLVDVTDSWNMYFANAPVSQGSYSWTIPAILGGQGGYTLTAGKQYKIELGETTAGVSKGYLGEGYSNVFSISQPSSIAITSPTSSNVSWQRGTLQTMTWISPSTVTSVDISLVSASGVFSGGSSSMLLIGGMPSSGTFSWYAGNWKDGVTSIAPDGNYTLYVCPTGTATGPSCGSFNLNIFSH